MITYYMKINLRLLYLYLFSFVGLIIVVFGGIQIVNLGLKTLVFKDADRYVNYPVTMKKDDPGYISLEQQKIQQDQQVAQQRQSELSNSIAMILIGMPLYLYHWKLIGKEKNDSQ